MLNLRIYSDSERDEDKDELVHTYAIRRRSTKDGLSMDSIVEQNIGCDIETHVFRLPSLYVQL